MENQRLAGKRALVTAAGQGIGKASAIALAEAGAHVFATDIDAAALSTIRDANHENIEIFEHGAPKNVNIRSVAQRSDKVTCGRKKRRL